MSLSCGLHNIGFELRYVFITTNAIITLGSTTHGNIIAHGRQPTTSIEDPPRQNADAIIWRSNWSLLTHPDYVSLIF